MGPDLVLGVWLAGAPEPLTGPTVSLAESCQWPTAVDLRLGGCSGVLIHPRVVLTAGHCLADDVGPAQIQLGEDAFAPALTLATAGCERHPDADGSVGRHDYGYCVLAEPVEVAIVAPLLGCELDALLPGQPTVTVGFGKHPDGAGRKRISGGSVIGWHEGTLGVSTGLNQVCDGDSGGPTYLRLPDGSWRLVGVSSGGPIRGDGCVEPLLVVPVAEAVAWVEARTGYDVSPCHLADGSWAPGPECTAFAATPNPLGPLAWAQGSCPDPRSGPLASCGPGIADPPETNPPQVELFSPADGARYPDAPATVEVTVLADDGDELAVMAVELFADGQRVASQAIAHPFEQPPRWLLPAVELPAGELELYAVATDYWGNAARSASVWVEVGGEPPLDPSSASGEQAGCAIVGSAPDDSTPLGLGIGLLTWLWLRRRTEP